MSEGSLRLYNANLEPDVRNFYEETWETTERTRKSFEEIGRRLTEYALTNVPLLNGEERINAIYAAPVLRAGVGLFRPDIVQLLKKRARELGVDFHTFAIGASRPHKYTDKTSADVYLNTLQYSHPDLSNAVVILYEFGEATGSTIEGVVKDLKKYNLNTNNLILLAGAACIDQSQSRLERVAPGMHIVAGSRWKYTEKEGPSQFYLRWMLNPETQRYDEMNPRDWGRCVSGMVDEDSVRKFILWMRDSRENEPSEQDLIYMSEKDQYDLFERYRIKIHERAPE
ncbi:MAG: hypothetical protein ACTSU6_00515 [Candidatus Njordarchaeales archaeon]